MQLSGRCLLLAASVLAFGGTAEAQSRFDLTGTFFHESGGPLKMTVITPSAGLTLDTGDVAVSAGYEADIVSGASVAVVDAPAADVDAISSATQLDDFRHTGSGSVTLRGEMTSMTVGYSYGVESDYKSHGFTLSGRAEMFERNTAFELAYARGIDRVCNVQQPRNAEAVDRRRMDDSDGCFEAGVDDRETLDLDLHTFQASWTQAWTPVLTTQLSGTMQLLDGYQGNPYRAVWLGRTAAQEHHPEIRARYAVGLGTRLWIKPLDGALILHLRGYRDTWGIESLTGELGYEQTILQDVRLRVRGRYYDQTGAVFYSDDYAFQPAGQYFTGDRELSPMSSITVGGRIAFDVPPDEQGDVLGFLTEFRLIGKADYIMHTFDEFHYGRADVPNDNAIVATLGLEAVF